MITYNKLKSCKVSLWFLQAMLTSPKVSFKVKNPWPPDARITRIEFPNHPNVMPTITVIVASKEFPELKDGDLIPEIEPPLFEATL